MAGDVSPVATCLTEVTPMEQGGLMVQIWPLESKTHATTGCGHVYQKFKETEKVILYFTSLTSSRVSRIASFMSSILKTRFWTSLHFEGSAAIGMKQVLKYIPLCLHDFFSICQTFHNIVVCPFCLSLVLSWSMGSWNFPYLSLQDLRPVDPPAEWLYLAAFGRKSCSEVRESEFRLPF